MDKKTVLPQLPNAHYVALYESDQTLEELWLNECVSASGVLLPFDLIWPEAPLAQQLPLSVKNRNTDTVDKIRLIQGHTMHFLYILLNKNNLAKLLSYFKATIAALCLNDFKATTAALWKMPEQF